MANEEQIDLLKQGVDVWNIWRENNPDSIIDLSDVKLIDVELKNINLSGADLSGANLSGADLRKADLSCSVLCKHAKFIGADLSGANLYKAQLRVAILHKANCQDANCVKSFFDRASLTQANFKRADLSGAYLCEANLSGADFTGAKLREANFHEAILSQIMRFGLDRAKFSNADLSRVNFVNANLSKFDLSNSDLSEAFLGGANITGTDFRDAIFTGSCIQDCNINAETNFEGVVCDYIYLKERQQERRPLKGNFSSGEFVALVQKSFETIDLIFIDGIDWQAFFQSFQQLRSKFNGYEIGIQAIEKKGTAFVVRLEAPPDADKSTIETKVKELYGEQLKVLEEQHIEKMKLQGATLEQAQESLVFERQRNTQLLSMVENTAYKDKVTQNFNAQVGSVAVNNEGDMRAVQYESAKNLVPSNPWMTFLSWFQNGQAIIAIIALAIGAASTYLIPKIFPNGFPPVNPDNKVESSQSTPNSPQIED